MSLYRQILATAKEFPDKTVLHGPEGSWSFRRLFRSAFYFSRMISDRIPEDGKRVGILLPEVRSFACSFFGLLRDGRIPVPLNILASPRELEYFVQDASLSCIITTKKLAKKHQGKGEDQLLCIETLLYEMQKALSEDPQDEVLEKAEPERTIPEEDRKILLYTSGSTSKPKGVVLSHKNLLSNIQGSVDAFHITPDDTLLSFLPLFHSFSLNCSLLLPLSQGATVKMYPRFSPDRALDAFQDGDTSIFFAISSQYRAIAKKARKRDRYPLSPNPSEQVFCVSGGEKLRNQTRKEFTEEIGFPVYQGYGLTETSPVISANTPEEARPGSVGKPLSNVRCRIADQKHPENVLEANQEGEIQVQAPSVMDEYYNRPEATDQAFTEDEWFRTGDLGKIDPEGYLHVTGRMKDVIISAGENIAPAEIEEVLLTHPGVEAAAVVGKEDERKGEVPVAFIQAGEGPSLQPELEERLNNDLPPVKRPGSYHFIEEMPKTSTGKVQKQKLKNRL